MFTYLLLHFCFSLLLIHTQIIQTRSEEITNIHNTDFAHSRLCMIYECYNILNTVIVYSTILFQTNIKKKEYETHQSNFYAY